MSLRDRLVCRLRGHDWRLVETQTEEGQWWMYIICERCGA